SSPERTFATRARRLRRRPRGLLTRETQRHRGHARCCASEHSKERFMQSEATLPHGRRLSREIAEGDRKGAMLGRGLGAFSIGLGLAELFKPHGVAELIGVDDCGIVPTTLRAFGVREIAAGVGLTARPTSPYGAWSRVLGDVLDLATLGLALRRHSV